MTSSLSTAAEQAHIHLVATLSQGGNESLARDLIAFWPAQGKHIVAVLGSDDGPMLSQFKALAAVHTLPQGWPPTPRKLWTFWRWLDTTMPRSLISYTFNIQAIPLCFLARLHGVSAVFMRVGNPPPSHGSRRQRWRWLIQLCRIGRIPLISCSASVHQQMQKLAALPSGSRPLLNGCHLISIAERAVASRLGRRPDDPRRVLMVARLDPIKDQATLLRAFAAAYIPGWQLQLVGEGPERLRLESLAMELGLDPAKVFLGLRSDIPELLGQADLFAFSTTASEGFGIALIEALAAGLPVLASDVPACREVLLGGAAGELLPPGDVKAWSLRLAELMSAAPQRQRLAARAVACADHYDIGRTSRQWYDLLECSQRDH